jgi:GTP diphosphokinase / guanosine-3',5'-bis(diphosphate) 3'-diphosphatase
LERVRELLENKELNAVEVVKEFKTNLVPDEVFAFTPKGDLLRLPQKSTIIDFAYEVHTRVGDECIGAKVNNKVVPLSYVVQNGDQIEIITSKKQVPKEEWLGFTRTSKAQNKIKEAVRRQKKIIAEKGREIFDWKFRNYTLERSQVIKELLAFFKIPNDLEFFYLLGIHKIDMGRLMEFIRIKEEGGRIAPHQQHHEGEEHRNRIGSKKEFESWLKENKGLNSDMLVIGEDMSIKDYKFAPCCQPVPGDDILAFFHPDESEVVIHRPGCPKAIALMSHWGRNVIKAKWTDIDDITFLAGVKIVGEDRQGMMNALIKAISNQLKLNIRSITIDSYDGMFEGVFKVFVRNTSELDKLQKQLRAVHGVMTVTRTGDQY